MTSGPPHGSRDRLVARWFSILSSRTIHRHCWDKANDSGDRQSQITALQVGWWKVNSTFHPVTNGLMPFESCQLEFGMVENGIYIYIIGFFPYFMDFCSIESRVWWGNGIWLWVARPLEMCQWNWVRGLRVYQLMVGLRLVQNEGLRIFALENYKLGKINLKIHQDKQNFKTSRYTNMLNLKVTSR